MIRRIGGELALATIEPGCDAELLDLIALAQHEDLDAATLVELTPAFPGGPERSRGCSGSGPRASWP